MSDARINQLAHAKLVGKDREFADSLVRQYHSRAGKLSEKQWYWVEKLSGPARKRAPELKLERIRSLIDHAAEAGSQWPTIRLVLYTSTLKLKRSGPRSKVNLKASLICGRIAVFRFSNVSV